MGCRVVIASDGAEALDVMGKIDGSLDMMITDVVMPGVGGVELAQKVGVLHPDLPVLFISGYTREKLDGGLLLEKPFTPDQLVLKVRDTLASA